MRTEHSHISRILGPPSHIMPEFLIPQGYEGEGITTERGEREGIFCNECPSMQEHHIAHILDSLEIWYEHRVNVNIHQQYFYTWDFFLGEPLGMVIQADGANGHGTNYSLNDDVMQYRIPYVKNILHVKAETEEELRDILIKAVLYAND